MSLRKFHHKLQQGGRPSTVRTGVQTARPESNNMQLFKKTNLLGEAPPGLLPVYSRSSVVLLCPHALESSNCSAGLLELSWTLL